MDYTQASLSQRLLYLSGPITNPDSAMQAQNMQRFKVAAAQFHKNGFVVFNPADLETEGWTWEMYLARDLHWIHVNRPTMFMMFGWQDSRGARLEWEYAKVLGLTIMEEK